MKEKEEKQPTAIEIAEQRFGKSKLDEVKALYNGRTINVIAVEDKVVLLGPLTAKALGNYTRSVIDPDKGLDVASKELINELWIIGDDELRDDDNYFISAMMELQNIVELKKSSFGKL